MADLTAKQIIGMLLSAGGRGIGQYYDLKQLQEQEKLQEENRNWIKTVRGWRKEDRQRNIADEKREHQVKQRAQAMLKFLGGNTVIPNANTMMQRAGGVLGQTMPPTVQAGALKEDLIRAGTPEPTAELARLKELGIAPKAPSEPTQTEGFLKEWLNPKTAPKRKEAIGRILFGKPDKPEKPKALTTADKRYVWDELKTLLGEDRFNDLSPEELTAEYNALGQQRLPKRWVDMPTPSIKTLKKKTWGMDWLAKDEKIPTFLPQGIETRVRDLLPDATDEEIKEAMRGE